MISSNDNSIYSHLTIPDTGYNNIESNIQQLKARSINSSYDRSPGSPRRKRPRRLLKKSPSKDTRPPVTPPINRAIEQAERVILDVLGTNDLSSLSTSIGKHKSTKFYRKRRRSRSEKTKTSPSTEAPSINDGKGPMTTRWDPEVLQKTGKLQQSVVKDETKSADM
jgi:hypothetical protein